MKKLFGSGGIKGFFVHHCEKLLLGLALLIGLFLIFKGMSDEGGISENYDPASLSQRVSDCESRIGGFSKTDFDERWEQQNFTERAEAALKAINPASYVFRTVPSQPLTRPRTMRTDPAIFPAENLIARAGYGSVSLVPERKDPDAEDEDVLDREDGMSVQLKEGERPIPTGMGGGGGEGGRYGGMGGGKTIGKFFVVVTGLVPYQKQLQQHNQCLADSSGYDPSRDMPRYDNWILERAEVVDEKPGAWKPIANKFTVARDMKKYATAGASFDPVPTRYRKSSLTMPLIPISLPEEQFEELMRHDAIPSLEQEHKAAREAAKAAGEDETKGDGEELDMFSGPAGDPGAAGGYGGGEFGGYGDEGFGEGGYGGDEGGYGGEPGGYGGGYGDEGFGEGGYGGGSTMVAGQRPDPLEFPEHVMFRYVDLNVGAGRAYQYRLKLWIEDPNDPDARIRTPPPANSLDRSVQVRLTSREELSEGMKRSKIRNRYWRETEPSELSTIAQVGTGRSLIAGVVEPVALDKIGHPKPGTETTASLMALEFDSESGMTIPAKLKVWRGSAADITMDVEVPDWGARKLVTHEGHRLSFNAAVLDMEGGTPLGLGDLTAPSELLVFQDGRLTVLDEIDGSEEFARYDFAPAVDPTAERGGYGMEGMDEERGSRRSRRRRGGDDEGYGGGMGEGIYGGEEGGGRPSRRSRRGMRE